MAVKSKGPKTFAQIKAEALKTHGEHTFETGSEFFEGGIERISTGIIPLDLMLDGGFPKGHIVDLYGAEGSGKCLTQDTLISTPVGLLTIADIFSLSGVSLYAGNQETEVAFPFYDIDGNVQFTKLFTNNGLQPIVEVVTESGRRIRSTLNHPHWVRSYEDNVEDYVVAAELRPGDFLQKFSPSDEFDSITPYSYSYDQAYVLGVISVKGYISTDGAVENVPLFMDPSSELEVFFSSPEVDGFNLIPHHDQVIESPKLFDVGRDVGQIYIPLGAWPTTLQEREIPLNIRMGGRETLLAFVKGLIESGATFNGYGLSVSLPSSRLASQVQVVLDHFGIYSSIRSSKINPEIDVLRYDVVLPGGSFSRYREVFGVPEWDVFGAQLDEAIESYDPTHDYARIVDPSYDKILEVNFLEESEFTFDFSMDGDPHFIANGIKTHNTGVALSALANAQKDGTCVYFDQEKAFDPKLAELVGVNLDDIYRVRLRSMEDVLNTMIDMAESGEVPLVIVDSVAGLTPRALIEGEIGDANVGLEGRILSQFTKKFSQSDSKMTTIGINQLRDKIGAVGFQKKWYSTGGRAWKFYSSIRLHVANIGAIKDGDQKVGHRVNLNGDKVRMSMPMQKAGIDILYGVGYDNEGFIVDAGVELGLIKKSGSWYTDLTTGESLGQGRASVTDFYRDDPDEFERMKGLVLAGITEDAMGGVEMEEVE